MLNGVMVPSGSVSDSDASYDSSSLRHLVMVMAVADESSTLLCVTIGTVK